VRNSSNTRRVPAPPPPVLPQSLEIMLRLCAEPSSTQLRMRMVLRTLMNNRLKRVAMDARVAYRISRARGMAKYMPITASAPTMLIEAAAHCAPTNDENAPMNIPPTNNTTWVI
jgi:hypothetical protein